MTTAHTAALCLAATFTLSACAAQPKQAEPDAALLAEGGDEDMQATPDDTIEPHVETAADKAEKVRKQKHKCCSACQSALDKDRSGDAPDKIPCADFTADLDEPCLGWFRKNPLMAAQAKQCSADSAPPDAPPAGGDGAKDAAAAGESGAKQ